MSACAYAMCSHGGRKTVSHPLKLNSGLLEKEKMLLINSAIFLGLIYFFAYLSVSCLSVYLSIW